MILSNIDIVHDGLIVHYDMINRTSYDRVGSIVNDLSGLGHNGTLNNGPIFTTDGGLSFDGINDSLVYQLDIPQDMTHIIFAKSNLSTWSNYNILGCSRSNNGWSVHPWIGTTDINFGFNGNLYSNSNGIRITPSVDITTPHMYAITTNGASSYAYINDIEYVIPNTVNRDNSTTNATIRLAEDDVPYNDRYGNITIYIHLLYNRQLSKSEMMQNYLAMKNYF